MTASTDWSVSTVSNEFEVQLGKRLDAAVNRGELRSCINNRGVRWGHVLVKEAIQAPLTAVDIRELRLVAGDVLMCEGGEIGRAAVWNGELREAYFLNTLHRLRSKGRYDPHLLVAFFERWASTGELSSLVGKATLAHLTKENLVRVPLPLPPSDEQAQIVAVLGDADQLIAVLERMIAKKQAIKHGMMQQLLTGRTRLPGFLTKWVARRLRDCGLIYGGLTGKTKDDFGVGRARYVTFLDVIYNTRITSPNLEQVGVRRTERQNQVLRGDVLFNGSSETPEEVALSAVVDFEPQPSTYLNSFCFGYRLKEDAPIDSTYLSYFFRASPGRTLVASLAQGATRYNIAKTKFLELAPLLPSVDEQAAIVGVLHDADDEIAALRTRLAKARDIKQGMMQRLLTGRTRLPPAQETAT